MVSFHHAFLTQPLGLKGLVERIPLTYQNEEVWRLSEDGRGIMGFWYRAG
nr:hypothetical protein [Salmonella sp.]